VKHTLEAKLMWLIFEAWWLSLKFDGSKLSHDVILASFDDVILASFDDVTLFHL